MLVSCYNFLQNIANTYCPSDTYRLTGLILCKPNQLLNICPYIAANRCFSSTWTFFYNFFLIYSAYLFIKASGLCILLVYPQVQARISVSRICPLSGTLN